MNAEPRVARPDDRARTARAVAAFALAYLAAAELGRAMADGGGPFVPFWPPVGVFLAVLVAHPPRRWSWLVAAAVAANLASEVGLHASAWPPALAFAAANVVQAVLAAALLARLAPMPFRFDSIRSAIALGVAVMPSAAVGAAIGAAAAATLLAAPFAASWLRWWIADTLGVLIVAPLAMAALLPGEFEPRVLRARAVEAAVLATLTVGAAAYLFLTTAPLPLSYMLLLLLIWAALRFGVVGSALAAAALAAVAVYGTLRGPTVADSATIERLVLVQSMVAAYAFTALLVATMFRQQRLSRHALRAALEEKSTMLQAISDHSQDLIFAKDARGRLLFANPAFERFFGRPPRELIGRDTYAIMPDPAAARAIDDSDRQVMATGQAVTVEETVRFAAGAVTFLSTKMPLTDPARGVIGLVGISHDLTERKRVEDALRESERRTRLAMQASRMYAFEWDAATDRVLRSPECVAILGLPEGSQDHLDEAAYLAMIEPSDRARYAATLRGIGPGHDAYSVLYRVRRPDGQIVTLEEIGQGFFGACGTLERLGGVTMDVSQRERTADALQLSEERHAALAAAMPALMLTALPDGACDFANDTWCAFTGLARADAMGRGWLAPMHPDDREAVWQARSRAMAEDAPYVLDCRYRRADGAWRWLHGRAAPVRDRSGRTRRWVEVMLDVDDQRRAEQALREADRRKDEFLAMLAHELRNPLSPIRNGAELLRRALRGQPALEETVRMLLRQTLHLSRLVDDLLDVARITQGRVKLQRDAVDLNTVLHSAVEATQPLIDAQGQHLQVDWPPRPLIVQVDATRLSQVVANLLSNAAKYSEPGSRIWLSAHQAGDGIEIRVRDEGMGIGPDLLPNVFDLFTQGERTIDRARGGLGIGLALVRQLIELHGGSVAAHSEGAGRGAEFVVRLPGYAAARPAQSA